MNKTEETGLMVKEFNGVSIQIIEGKEVNLTNMWKSVGSPKNNDPGQWITLVQTKTFMDSLCKKLNMDKNQVWRTQQGRYFGGTWGHWQIALEYARYLSPELALMMNEVFRERLQEEKDPELALNRGKERAIRGWQKQGRDAMWITQRIQGIDSHNQTQSLLKSVGVWGSDMARCINNLQKPMLGMNTAAKKRELHLKKGQSLRDHLTTSQLATINLANVFAYEEIKERNLVGGDLCVNACKHAGTNAANVYFSMKNHSIAS